VSGFTVASFVHGAVEATPVRQVAPGEHAHDARQDEPMRS